MKYEKPIVRDLTGRTTQGQLPLGQCVSGGQLTFAVCSPGPSPVGGDCAPNGATPEQGYCDLGGLATEGCNSGSGHF